MAKITVLKCEDCNYYNKSKLGDTGFIIRQSQFRTLAEAIHHLEEYPDHDVIIVRIKEV